jgi:GNAT superfamily N-acetyltransferase
LFLSGPWATQSKEINLLQIICDNLQQSGNFGSGQGPRHGSGLRSPFDQPGGSVLRTSHTGATEARLRLAQRNDIADIHRIRLSVSENRLVSTTLSESDYVREIGASGRGWVIECRGNIIAFGVANSVTGSIWALFVDPGHEGLGYGRRLHDRMVTWLWQEGHEKIWLTTEANTRARRFYEAAGWTNSGTAPGGELRYELSRQPKR